MRYADASNDPRRADGTGTDANFQRIGASVDQSLGRTRSGDVTDHNLLIGPGFLHAANHVDHVLRMTVCGIDDQQVDPCFGERLGPIHTPGPHANSSATDQAALTVLAGVGIVDAFLDVLDGDQATEVAFVIHDQQFFDAMLVQFDGGIVEGCATGHRDQILAGHELAHQTRRVFHKTQVAVGQNTHEFFALGHRHTADPILCHECESITDGFVRPHGDRVGDHARLAAFHPQHMLGLDLGREILVDDTNAALASHRHGHGRLGHRVHGCREQRNIEFNASAQLRSHINVGGCDFGIVRQHEDVVEGQRLGESVGHDPTSQHGTFSRRYKKAPAFAGAALMVSVRQ